MGHLLLNVCGYLNGQGNEACLFRENGMIAHMILIEPCDYAVTISGNSFVKLFFHCTQPVFLLFHSLGICAYLSPEIEIAIPEWFLISAGVNPIPIHSKRPKENTFVVLPEIVVEEEQTFGFEFEEHWIDQLHHIIPRHARKQCPKF